MNFCVLGAGAWGTAIAVHLNRLGESVTLVPRRVEHALQLASSRENTSYLPKIPLPYDIQIVHELKPALMEADVVFMACPSAALRDLCQHILPCLEDAWRVKLFVTLCKGVERESFKRPVEVVDEYLGKYGTAVLSGPSNAMEVALGKPTALVLASTSNDSLVLDVQSRLSGGSLRVYHSTDVVGVELGGALKNVYALGAGMADGLALGDNAKSAYLTRALNEMLSVGRALGGEAMTYFGLSGFGDLVATSFGAWSRNRTFGEQIANGQSPEALLAEKQTVVEGYWTCKHLHDLCHKHNVQAPILDELHSVLFEGKRPDEALQALMERELKAEFVNETAS